MRANATRQRPNFADLPGSIGRARLTWRLLRDPRVPTWSKAMLPVVAGAYFLLPLDLIPDVILGLGHVDDLSVFGIALFAMTKLLPRLAPGDVVEEHVFDLRAGNKRRRRGRDEIIEASYRVVSDETRDSA